MHYDYLCDLRRPLPIKINVNHAEYRYIQRTSNPLQYHDLGTQYSFVLGLGFAKVIGDLPDLENGNYVPAAFPHPRGLFIGNAQKTATSNQYCEAIATDCSTETPEILTRRPPIPMLDVQAEITANTFYDKSDLSQKRAELWSIISPLLDEENEEAINSLWHSFINRDGPEYEKYRKKAQPLLQKIEAIVQSDIWKLALKSGWDHIPATNQTYDLSERR